MLAGPMEEESAEERLLYSSRHGDVESVHDLLEQRSARKLQLNIDCEGQSKANLGWTPLHLASYFGHKDVVQLLLDNGANVNVVNNVGDTPLHRAAFTGRMEVVMLLLKNKAKVDMINAEGNSPNYLARTSEIKNLIEAAEAFEQRCLEEQFLKLAREGDTEGLTKMLKSPHPPCINCTDTFGNTALHSAAYCRQRAAAALLLENGINTSVKNNKGQVALDMARDEKMRQLMDVLPIKKVQRNVQRFEGSLLKKSRIFGWKPVWVVLERGVLGVFKCRGDASTGSRRKAFKYLDDARVQARMDTGHVFGVHFSDNTSFLLSVLPGDPAEVARQKWENALNEHITYSTHFVHQGVTVSDEEDDLDILPLGSMQDVLQSSHAHHHLLEKEVQQLTAALEALPADQLNEKAVALLQTRDRLAQIVQLSKEMCSSLSHCLDVFTQQEQVRKLRLQQEVEKSRVLEDALHILAEQHNQLEQSIGGHRSSTGMFDPDDDDEFFDCADNDDRTQSSSFAELFHSFNETSMNCSTPVHSTRHQTQHKCSNTNGNSLEQNCGAEGQSSIMCGDDQDGRNNSGAIKQIVTEPNFTGVSKWGGRPVGQLRRKCGCNVTQSVTHQTKAAMDLCDSEGCDREILEKDKYRCHLPAPMFSKNDFSVWSILKQCIGRELSKITMPVIFNEPLSFLERIAEYMEYTSLVEQAAACDDPIERLELVTAFAVSATASNWDRLGKPFNPLLGETYELEREDLGFKIVCEQVSHHPPVSAFHAQSDVFRFYGSIHPRLKFWGKSIEITPKGTVTLHLLKHDEVYTWQNVNCCVHNIIVGKLWIEHYGSMEIVNHKTKHKAVVNFKPCGWFGKDLHVIDGGICDSSGKKVREFYGKWIEALYSYDVGTWENHQRSLHANGTTAAKVTEDSCEKGITCNQHVPGQRLLWVAEPKPDDSSQYYSFTTFAMMLNEVDADLCKKLPPTDARRRPDIRKMEEGDLDGATAEKTRLEEKQRSARKERRRTKEEWKPIWFSWMMHEEIGREDWICSSDYWQRDWDNCPDIF